MSLDLSFPMLAKSRGLAHPLRAMRVVTAIAASLIIIFMIISSTTVRSWAAPEIPSPPPAPIETPPAAKAEVIQNHVHFVYILPESTSDFGFQFSHFLSIFAAWHYWKPDAIFLHTNAEPDGAAVTRARNGTAGKWTRHIFTLFDMRIHTVAVPTHTRGGKAIEQMEHRSDFVRVRAVHDLGGAYLDWDVHALRDIRPLRESGFRAVGGRQMGGELNSGTFLAVPGARMIALWMDRMHDAYTGSWTAHSNAVLTDVGQRLVREPGEMLILDREAFAPGSWEAGDNEMLFAVHGDAVSNLEGWEAESGEALPLHKEDFYTRWDHPDRFPGWERDWSCTYLLHAFSPDRYGRKIEGFEHITPRYVLERRSNFARAVYPVAKIMYEQGLIDIDDSHV